jgi:hypothetical protein
MTVLPGVWEYERCRGTEAILSDTSVDGDEMRWFSPGRHASFSVLLRVCVGASPTHSLTHPPTYAVLFLKIICHEEKAK